MLTAKRHLFHVLATALLGASALQGAWAEKPNIVYILADDLGYGDVQCLNPERCKIDTPRMDRIAAEGMVFTDAHSSSSVCTPTRYGILTGRYNWRTRLQKQVLYGYDQPLIARDVMTVGELLQEQGYTTACFGKWHLGLEFVTTDGKPVVKKGLSNIDWKAGVADGPVNHGFDTCFGIPASLDMPPFIYIENDTFVGECTVLKRFMRQGEAQADFEAVEVLPDICRKTVEFIGLQSSKKPFFAYVALPSPHTPIVPAPAWKGKSPLGRYGDFVMQTDAVIGEIMDALEANGLADNTLVIVTSDNGCSKAAKIDDLQEKGHYPSAQYRGSKSDLWDGGHRVPFLVRWPAAVTAGSQCDETICLVDLMATCAALTGAAMPQSAGVDSVNFAPALKGEPIVSARKGVVHHSINGNFAYRSGKWKLLLTQGSGGWTKAQKVDTRGQLYDMETDPGEITNLYESHPEVVERLLKQLESDVDRGRSTDGVAQKNDVQIKIWK
jgi:arylsulfatase A-like enzyme